MISGLQKLLMSKYLISRVDLDDYEEYERIRESGEYNMITDGYEVMKVLRMSPIVYKHLINNYSTIRMIHDASIKSWIIKYDKSDLESDMIELTFMDRSRFDEFISLIPFPALQVINNSERCQAIYKLDSKERSDFMKNILEN